MTIYPFAHSVVWRHGCDCPTASRPLEPGEESEHRFDVDGEPFPWHLHEERPATFRKLLPHNVFEVSLRIMPVTRATSMPLEVSFDFIGCPSIGGVKFPWALARRPVIFTASRELGPILELTFIAEHVDSDGPIIERCKHCSLDIARDPRRSNDYSHLEGDQQGKHTCAVEPYGFHAEPVGAPCGDHPANPCNGARGWEVRA